MSKLRSELTKVVRFLISPFYPNKMNVAKYLNAHPILLPQWPMIGSEDIRGCMPRRLSSRKKEPLEELTG